ncbi:MAG: flagellar biosynthetic protein FliR [Acidobacteria bacterium]|nr:flagellar biosynthetic protein FliR [Acidobacteriota bacterium]
MEPFEIPLRPVLIFLVVLARIGGLVSFAPFWAHKAANFKIRVVMALVLTLALAPVLAGRIETPPAEAYGLLVVLAGELVIGAIMGFVGRLVFSGLETAAHFLAAQMGFSLAGTIDPSTQAQTTAFGTIAQMFGLLVLLGANGHHWFLAAAVKSFSTTPPGSFTFSGDLLDLLLRFSANTLVVGVTLAAPAIIVLLAVEFAIEFFGRTAPQFQVFILGFPLKIGVGLWIVGASLYFLPASMRDILSQIYHGLIKAMGAM